MMRVGMTALAAAGLLVAGQASAQTGQKVSFSVGGVALEVAPPAGFCVPTGMAQDAVRKALPVTEKDNATLATFFPCDRMSEAGNSDYFVIKSIRALADAAIEREELLKALTAEMSEPNISVENLSSKAGKDTGKALSALSGTEVKVTTDMRMLGRDTDCAYMGGVVVARAEATMSLNVGGCMTAVGGRAVMVYRYAAGTTMAGAKPLLPQVRNLAMAIRVKK